MTNPLVVFSDLKAGKNHYLLKAPRTVPGLKAPEQDPQETDIMRLESASQIRVRNAQLSTPGSF